MQKQFYNLIFVAIITLLSTTVYSAKSPRILLHLSFENNKWVAFSKSNSDAYADYPNIVKGHKGNGTSIKKRGEYGEIETAGNIDKAKGTISFWYKPEMPSGKKSHYGLFSSGKWGRQNKNCMFIWLWQFRGGRIRFDVDATAKATCNGSSAKWAPGKWVYITCTWDHKSGVAIYINGKLNSKRTVKWTPVKTKSMVIGLKDSKKNLEIAGGVIDEFKIYDRALTPEQIRQDYAGTLKAAYAPKDRAVKEKLAVKKKLFKLSFDKGFEADIAAGNRLPTIKKDVTLVSGFKGKGAQFAEHKSRLVFNGEKNIFSGSGSVSLWMKLNWEPAGNGFPVSKVGTKAIGLEHTIFSADTGRKSNNITGAIANFVYFTWPGSRIWLAVNRQVLRSSWHQYVFTWNSKSREAHFFLDGKNISSSTQFKTFEKPFKRLIFGSSGVSIDGVIDEVSIYNYALDRDEVMVNYSRESGLSIDLLDYAAFTKKSRAMRLKFINNTSAVVTKQYTVNTLDSRGNVLRTKSISVSVKPHQSIIKEFVIKLIKPGLYYIDVLSGQQKIKRFETIAIDEKNLSRKKSTIKPGQVPDMKLIESINCADNFSKDKYRDDNSVNVRKTAIGTYREAQNISCSGFAYKIVPLANPGKAHWLEIEYPDDKVRTFMVAVFQEKDGHVDAKGLDTMGIITGKDHPLTGKMQTKRMLFRPDSKNIMVGCYAYKEYPGQAGPALAKIKIYENAGPMPKRLTGVKNNLPQRTIGLWQEDPGMTAYSWFSQDTLYDNTTLDFWQTKWSRIIDYIDFSGQNLWTMLVFDYWGDTALNSNQLSAGEKQSRSGRMPGWADVGALMLDRKNVIFYTALHDRVSIKGTPAGLTKMISPGKLRHEANMKEVLAGTRPVADCIASNDYYTGCYNPLNPITQEAYAKLVGLYAEKFGRYRNYGGVHFLSTKGSSLYFHNLQEGYSDYNIKQFEKETGIRIPVSNKENRRFGQRYQWLMKNAKVKWVKWRCQKIRSFYQHLSAIIQKYNPNAKLVISLRVKEGFASVNKQWPLKGTSLAEYWRGCGIDFDLYKQESNIVLMQAISPYRDRVYGRTENRYNCFNPEVSALIADHAQRSAFISYHSNLEFLPWNKQRIPSYWWKFGSWGGKVNGPIHAFANVVPSREYILEFMTHTLAGSDAKRIIHGWWGNPDNGNIAEFSKFYAAFRSIPAFDFKNIPDADDPVRVRYYNADKNGYIYFVNQLPYPVSCALKLKNNHQFKSTLDARTFNSKDHELSIKLKPYQVLCLVSGKRINPIRFSFTIADKVSASFKKEVSNLRAKINTSRISAKDKEILQATYQKINTALTNKKYAALSHLLQSPPVIKLLNPPQEKPKKKKRRNRPKKKKRKNNKNTRNL
jgi:concanavalin A-like lectin/glucanase superfamily protein